MKGARRKTRIMFCEWSSTSFGYYNNGGIICGSCNFSRSLNLREEKYSNYQADNKIVRNGNCPECNSKNWYWLPPIARVPKKGTSKNVWNKFWEDLKNRRFNHPEDGCR